jgi:hypothetical protein
VQCARSASAAHGIVDAVGRQLIGRHHARRLS